MLKKLRPTQQKREAGVVIHNYLPDKFKTKLTMDSITFVAFIALLLLCMYPDTSLATSLEGQLDKVGGIANGKFKTIGLTAATIAGSIWSVVKGNLKLTGIIIAIGVSLSLYLEWITGGMKLTA